MSFGRGGRIGGCFIGLLNYITYFVENKILLYLVVYLMYVVYKERLSRMLVLIYYENLIWRSEQSEVSFLGYVLSWLILLPSSYELL